MCMLCIYELEEDSRFECFGYAKKQGNYYHMYMSQNF